MYLKDELWESLSVDEKKDLKALRGDRPSSLSWDEDKDTGGSTKEHDSRETSKNGEDPIPVDPHLWIQDAFKWWCSLNVDQRELRVADYAAPINPVVDESGYVSFSEMDWLKLFVFSAAHSVGWGQARRARAFVEWAENKGMLQTMIDHPPRTEGPSDDGPWLQMLKEQANNPDREQDYSFRTLFAQMHRMRLKLNDYRNHLLAFNKWPQEKPVPTNWVEDPTHFPDLPDHINQVCLASLPRVFGPVGTSVLIRELQRLGVLIHPSFVRLGFAPSGAILRKLREARGGNLSDSVTIHSHITKALEGKDSNKVQEFICSFDIPLRAWLA